MPYQYNLLHYYSQKSIDSCLVELLNLKCSYHKDYLERAPITFALKKESKKTIDSLIMYSINQENFVKSISQDDLVNIIKNSSVGCTDFFNHSVFSIETNVPSFGTLQRDVIFKTNENNSMLKEEYEKLILNNKDEDKFN